MMLFVLILGWCVASFLAGGITVALILFWSLYSQAKAEAQAKSKAVAQLIAGAVTTAEPPRGVN